MTRLILLGFRQGLERAAVYDALFPSRLGWLDYVRTHAVLIKHRWECALSIALSSVLATSSFAATEPIVVTQVSSGNVIVNVSTVLEQGCQANPTYLFSPAPIGYFQLFTSLICPPPATPALYMASVDLGIVPDGDYTVLWGFLAFGPCCGGFSKTFSVRNGVLLSIGNPIPSLSPFALLMLALLVALTGYALDPLQSSRWYRVVLPRRES